MNFLDRRNKIGILQERANLYNDLQDQLIDQQVNDNQQKIIIDQALEDHTRQSIKTKNQLSDIESFSKTQPKPPVSVLTTSAMISLGFDNYKSMTTQTQDNNNTIQQQYLTMKNLRKTGQLPESYKEEQKKLKEEDEIRQKILFKCDHIKEYEDATHRGFNKYNSRYKQDHQFTDDIKDYLKSQDKKNNLQKNDLNTFYNDYIKHRSTLRK